MTLLLSSLEVVNALVSCSLGLVGWLCASWFFSLFGIACTMGFVVWGFGKLCASLLCFSLFLRHLLVLLNFFD